MLGHALVQGKRHRQGIGECVRNAIGVQQGRHLSLPTQTMQAFGDIEHQIPALTRHQPPGKLLDVADPLRLMPQATQDIGDSLDGLRAIEFGSFLISVTGCQVRFPEIIGHPYSHDCPLTSPRRPPGSG